MNFIAFKYELMIEFQLNSTTCYFTLAILYFQSDLFIKNATNNIFLSFFENKLNATPQKAKGEHTQSSTFLTDYDLH